MSEIIPNVVVSMPSQLFTMARSFKACSNGKIYIGKIDTDPTIPENQIQVYMERENGDLVPAPQPIIINAAGYPVYAGQIAKFVTVEGHSMAVYDSYGAQQFYFPNILKYEPDRLKQQLSSDTGYQLVGGLSANYMRVYDTVADMRSDTGLMVDYLVKTRGFYARNDGGEAIYLITNNTSDDLVNLKLDNGLTASLESKTNVNILSVGAKADTDIGGILSKLQDIAEVNTILIPAQSFDCNTKINVKKNFKFSNGAQIINRTLRDDMFVFEIDHIEFSTEGYGNKARIAVDTVLTGWDHAVCLVLGKNNLRNITICNLNLVGCKGDKSGTSLMLRADLSGDGGQYVDERRRWNSICWGRFNNLTLGFGKYALQILAVQPKKEDVVAEGMAGSDGGSWITSCQFKNLHIEGAQHGFILKCVPIVQGQYPYNTQIAEIQSDFVQQWGGDAVHAVYIDGAGQNKINFFAWDYDGYPTKPEKMVVVKGIDGGDNIISGNASLNYVEMQSYVHNVYKLEYEAEDYTATLHRRICCLKSMGSKGLVIDNSYYTSVGIYSVESYPQDDYAFKLKFRPGYSSFQRPYVMCTSCNNADGITLKPLYNNPSSSVGESYFYLMKANGELIKPNQLSEGMMFFVEIICV
ncbi:phage head-binding domain-containing protein [Xenorhabdus sp. XENO-7]|uniref:Phage head-binding domain-containing protein n=1 Tax=Xenorhabdus aichiensis TaxID=3025874 RepID=A0ABT5M055_9GAMM|nr:phage head-binding domain-containing protein [Xenorhabdus aichiensis]MDC9621063.1 phage head-binding domain-containing protein [Xenorhabdus aichiensis]